MSKQTKATGTAIQQSNISKEERSLVLSKDNVDEPMSQLESEIRKATMMAFIVSMCVALPVTLFPVWLLSKWNVIDEFSRQKVAHDIAQSCARGLLKIMPFIDLQIDSDIDQETKDPEPRIWVCNHESMLDTFVLLASDLGLRGPNKRPIKVIYWKGLEENPVINLMFGLCGFIPVAMEANGSGNHNEYDIGSFKTLLRATKKAFAEGFDILVLPEGQLNPWPEKGLLEIFPGAYKLSLMSKRKIQMVALHGCHNLWHADESIGMKVSGKTVKFRGYSPGRMFESTEDFVGTFQKVVGHFSLHGEDLPKEELTKWLDGSAWQEIKDGKSLTLQKKHQHTEGVEEDILSLLESKSLDGDTQAQLEQASPARFPVGVHTRKAPMVIHELVHQQLQRDEEVRTEFKEGKASESQEKHQRTEDVEEELLSLLEGKRLDGEHVAQLDPADQTRYPVGVHTRKPPLVVHEFVPQQQKLDEYGRVEVKEGDAAKPQEKHQRTKDVEEEILSLLESKRLNDEIEPQLDLADQARYPVGVHTRKPPLVIHEFVPQQLELDESVWRAIKKEQTSLSPGSRQCSEDVEEEILSLLEGKRLGEEIEKQLIPTATTSRSRVGIHARKSPLVMHEFIPKQLEP